ncbi:nucleoside phosphatase family-domain-containing protein [Daldinia decipiens]|uniref:nucleoside phosphatase family-domain-containing protein n=1 Tax=Daldinia decipiens TaxID=326647 RepID=UPI0020C39D30|nr:nucleoside phosphatase family-domain-containing protein [Daldinia decipiens]KAI1659862.1 nucleoside phosphatase family-domain-containing protein [Daldinia decipiens]
MGKRWRWGIILDAGSSGTRLHIYRWLDPAKALKEASYQELHSLPNIVTKDKWTKKIRPGISTFGDHPEDVGPDHLQELVERALDVIPDDKHADTPIFLMATAGMRLLPPTQQRAVITETCSYFRANTRFSLPDCDTHIQVIPGETEGLYGWIAANYLLGGFDDPDGHAHGKNHHTYGFLDMGGASAQIAFAPNATVAEEHGNDLKLLRMRSLNGEPKEYKVFTSTWLGFGVNQARERYVKTLVDEFLIDGEHEVPDPCLPRGLRTNDKGEAIKGNSKELELVGTGEFDECLRRTKPLLGKDMPCEDKPCLFNGQHVPPIDFDVNHFVGVSEYWHTTHGVFGNKDDDTAYDFNTYQKKVLEFCSQHWEDIESNIEARKKDHGKEAQEACFKASWLISVLHEGIGIPRYGIENTPTPGINVTKGIGEAAKEKGFLHPFQAADEVNNIEISWTLGKMVLYAAGQIPPKDNYRQPVGFGSNVKGIPSDFQYAGSSFNVSSAIDGEDDWGDTAEDLIDHAKSKSTSGLFFFLLIFLFIAFLLRKRDRRMRLYGKVNKVLRRRRRPGSPRKLSLGLSAISHKLFGRGSYNYERVLEEGDANQFELGEASSDEGDNSDSSGGASRVGRSSGLATPKLNVDSFDDIKKHPHPGNALDRSGLVVRTESRERLFPQMLTAGRRSRAGSPTRLKSPLMSPLTED